MRLGASGTGRPRQYFHPQIDEKSDKCQRDKSENGGGAGLMVMHERRR